MGKALATNLDSLQLSPETHTVEQRISYYTFAFDPQQVRAHTHSLKHAHAHTQISVIICSQVFGKWMEKHQFNKTNWALKSYSVLSFEESMTIMFY